MTGLQFASSIVSLPLGPERELAIFQQLTLGNVPEFLRTPKTLTVKASGHIVHVDVLLDVLCVGTDDDFMRVPLNPKTAQKAADLFGGTLITPALSDLIWQQADVRIDPLDVTMPPTPEMTTTTWFINQNLKVEKHRAGRLGLLAGHKKDVVLCNALSRTDLKNKHVAIYGWHRTTGQPIQGLNPSSHSIEYADYSHGIRLIADDVLVDGNPVAFTDAVADPALASALNKDGVLMYTRYPTT